MKRDLSGLNAFVCVANERSFTAAAAVLRVSPSAVSLAVRGLEQRVGVRLLQRTTRSVGLTEAGARFLDRLQPALEGLDDAFDSLAELRDTPAGLHRVTLPRLAYTSVIGPRLSTFLEAFPSIDVELSVDDAFVDVVGARFDIGMRIGEMLEREMVAVRAGDELRVAIVGSPGFLATHGVPQHPRELAEHPCIGYRRRSLDVISRWEFTESGRDFSVSVGGRVTFDDADGMVDAALQGLGLAYVMESQVSDYIGQGRLVRVLERYCTPFPGLYLYYPSRAQIAPKIQAFVDFFKAPARARRHRGNSARP